MPEASTITGAIEDCGSKPNCVSTKATNPDRRIPVINFNGSPEDFKKYSLGAIQQMPRFKIVSESSNSIAVEFTSLLLRFTDDFNLEYVPATSSIHMRSASRIGYSDLGVNLKRTEQFRSLFLKQIEK